MNTNIETNRLRMVIVGCGRGQSHARSMLTLSDKFELVGLVDIDEKRLKTAIDNLGLPADLAYTSFAEALEKSECDGVVVATWARSHDPLVEEAIEAGKHIMVEKPFTLEVAPARRLTEMAEARDLKIVVTQQWRYMPGRRMIRRLMTEKAYGELQTGHMVTYKARGGEYPDSEHSQLWQMTVHEIDALVAMVNQNVAEVYGHSYRPPATTWRRESTATAEIAFESGARFVIVSTSDARAEGNEFPRRMRTRRRGFALHGGFWWRGNLARRDGPQRWIAAARNRSRSIRRSTGSTRCRDICRLGKRRTRTGDQWQEQPACLGYPECPH